MTSSGEVWTWGHQAGLDQSNGNLLGHGLPTDVVESRIGQEAYEPFGAAHAQQAGALVSAAPPRRLLEPRYVGAVAEVACSTYSNFAVTVDGRGFSWGDFDGGALGHDTVDCHVPTRLDGLTGLRVAHGAMCYPNGAAALSDGSVFVWGGGMWEGGLGGGQHTPSRVSWGGGVPPCYKCTAVVVAHRHGFLLLRKEP